MARSARRPPGPGGGSVLSLCFLLLCLSAAQQQLADSEDSLRWDQENSTPDLDGRAPSSILEHALHSIESHPTYRKKTDTITSNEKSVATLAPARINQAVRAPPFSSQEPAGLSSLLQARSLQDWDVEDFVLLATLDGVIHANDRRTGLEKWALGIANSPMVETIHHRQKNRSGLSSEEHTPEDDYMFVVEPSKDGNLYIQHKDPSIGLQRLGITVKSLAERTPQSFDSPPLVYTAKQETALYTVDAAKGKVLRQFTAGDAFITEEKSCKRISNFEMIDEEECEPRGTLDLGRVQYTVIIRSGLTGEPLCTIKYSEWTPNNRDVDLQSQYVEPKDKNHIYSLHDGRIIGIDYSQSTSGRRKFTRVLSSPVARIFDIVRPTDSMEGDTSLVLLPQPLAPPDVLENQAQIDFSEDRKSRVFVNCTEGGDWYAFSEMTYPMVTSQAEWARVFRTETLNIAGVPSLDDDEDRDPLEAYTGIQNIGSAYKAYQLRTLPAPDPGAALDVPANRDVVSDSRLLTNSETSKSRTTAMFFTVVLLSSACLLFAGRSIKGHELAKAMRIVLAFLRQGHEDQTPQMPMIHTSDQTPVNQILVEPDVRPVRASLPGLDKEDPLAQSIYQDNSSISRSASPSAAIRQSHPTGSDPSLELTEQISIESQGIDFASTAEADEDIKSDNALYEQKSNERSGENGSNEKPRKRGKRGGKKHKKGEKNQSAEGDAKESNEEQFDADAEPRNELHAMPPEAFVEDAPLTPVCPEKSLSNGLLQVGKIVVELVSSKVLGHGSNGTIVYPGEYQERRVAVKRLVRSPNSLAAREIRTLLKSDDNDNVIRYFGQEISTHFTWIALELFTASLDQIVEHPARYPEMIPSTGLDQIDVLTQITKGVTHIHRLKLVHRDLKPQNILVKARENLRLNGRPPELRYVISDFGLSKQLDENGPGSTFAPTANHTAAGTTGWRAPELLVDSFASIAAPPATNGDMRTSTNPSNPSGDGATVDLASGRRVTKAIDVFSLGCIFYYVMTYGHHPFDVGGSSLARDYNIKEDKKDLGDLRLDNYSFEADDLILQMLRHDPQDRISTFEILMHPYFWSNDKKLQFLCDFSDYFEHEKTKPEGSVDLDALQSIATNVIPKNDFLRALPQKFKDSLGKQRSYTGSRMLDLLRALRNKKNHFNDLDPELKANIEALPGGYWEFWAAKFPSLLCNCHWLVITEDMLERAPGFRKYFE